MDRPHRCAFVHVALIAIAVLPMVHCSEGPVAYQLDYDEMVMLDAEALAEAGMGEAYQALLPKLRQYVPEPAKVEEILDETVPSYSVRALGQVYEIFSPDLEDDEGQSWGRATYAFFSIINEQLAHSSHRFYAISGGNDLFGIFLTPAERESAIRGIENKRDWPYIPTDQHPWYGELR